MNKERNYYVEIDLTKSQKKKLEHVIDYAHRCNLDGKPGMILGQFHDYIFRVGFIENKEALKIQKIIDKKSAGKMYREKNNV